MLTNYSFEKLADEIFNRFQFEFHDVDVVDWNVFTRYIYSAMMRIHCIKLLKLSAKMFFLFTSSCRRQQFLFQLLP